MLIALAVAAAMTLPQGNALDDAIAARSREYFELFFNGCDPARLRSMLTPDVEMYHDRSGVRGTGDRPFVARYAVRCAERSNPGARKMRRELVEGSLEVWPVPGYGAIEQGRHVFYLTEPGKPERKVDSGRYLHLWKMTGTAWRLARVFSYDHEGVN